MSLTRLPFLYPQTLHYSRAWDAYTALAALPKVRKPRLHPVQRTCARRSQGSYVQRYGPAAEPGLPPSKAGTGDAQQQNEAPTASSLQGQDRDRKQTHDPEKKRVNRSRAKLTVKGATDKQSTATGEARNIPDADTQPERPATKPSSPISSLEPAITSELVSSSLRSASGNSDVGTAASPSLPLEELSLPATPPPLEGARLGESKPLEKVLYMEAPTGMGTNAAGVGLGAYDGHHKPPHLHPPPYVHHFDSYTLVKDLGKSGFTQDQSVTIMKAIRSLLAVNLDMAKEGLVSKSDVENETYLFRAASSELRTEIQNARRRTSDTQRSDRSHLQHDVDILAQEVTQKTQALRDELKGMFDDRKMAVRTEQREMESAIQEINRKITVALLGEGKGEVETLRWFLTRRVAMFIGFAAVCTIAYMRYSTYVAHLEELARERVNRSGIAGDGFGGSVAALAVPALRGGAAAVNAADSDIVLANAENGGKDDGAGYVSLG